MERRNWSIKALEEIIYISSLNNDFDRGERLLDWSREYLEDVNNFDLEVNDLKKLSELIYMNMNFLKTHLAKSKSNIKDMSKIKKFLNN
jgi:hypothetical protein